MVEYKEVNVSGIEYQRHRSFAVDHPFEGQLSFNFVEEKVTELEGLPIFITPVGNLIFPYNADETFIVYNSSTGEPYPATALNVLAVGGQILFKMSFLKEVILSLYKAKAEERDG
jgi:hypothetical protein